MTTALSPEEFMALPAQPDEEDVEPETTLTAGVAPDPLESIASSLGLLAAIARKHDLADEREEALDRWTEERERENRELEALHDAKQGLIEQVLALIKPSTSKLANSIRAVLEPVVTPPEPAPAEEPQPSSHPLENDASVEEWRAYARSQGYQGPDVDTANRSQIRTMLGIAQPVEDGAS